MSAVELSEDVVRRLTVEATRRGISVADLVADLAARLPEEDPLEAFIGSGSSGLGDLARRHREIRADETKDRPARDF